MGRPLFGDRGLTVLFDIHVPLGLPDPLFAWAADAARSAGLVFTANSYRLSTQGARQSGAGNGFAR